MSDLISTRARLGSRFKLTLSTIVLLSAALVMVVVLAIPPAGDAAPAAVEPAAQAASPAPRYHNYAPPLGLGANAGEPSIGVNPRTGKVFYVANSQTLRVSFDECASPAKALWEDVSPPDRTGATLDPILFTDTQTGRTFSSQLLGKASEMFYTDDDGQTWSRSQGSGINAGVDHQTVGSGPFAAPVPSGVGYPSAVYYCSQDAAVAQCALSLDGGRTFGPAIPMYAIAQCAGIHGHVKVAPDGTAYIPNKACEIQAKTPIPSYAKQAVIVSENNGMTWEVRHIPDSTAVSGIIDPSVGIGKDGTVYFAYRNGDGRAMVAVSRDRGKTWAPSKDVGATFGLKNVTFPEAVAGDGDRAAVAFLGTPTGGNYQAPIRTGTAINPAGFRGEWHLYIATTYDRGETWTTVDATPDDPVQRGSICNSGTTCANTPNDRNLLDFNDITVDAEGRVLAAYADGCVTQACIQGLDRDGDGFKDNDYSAAARIARQVSGKRLFAQFDPVGVSAPGAPAVSATRNGGGVVTLSWPVPDDGGSPITSYRVFRREASGSYPSAPLATVTTNRYVDESAASGTQHFYKVTAVNSVGESAACGEAEPVPTYDACTPPGIPVIDDTPKDSLDQLPSHDIRYVAVGEPLSAGDGNLVFTMKVADLSVLTPSTTWPINFIAPDGKTYFARMQTNQLNQVTFTYGTGTTATAALPTSNYKTDGTIQIVVPASGVGAVKGQKLRGFLSRILVVAITPDNAPGTLAGSGEYTVVGNASCAPNAAPLAVLRANPPAGLAPFTTTLDGAASTEADAGDSVAAYTFNFGDGTAPVTRTVEEFGTEASRVSHTYTAPGVYRASLTVRDTRGKVSLNTADALVTADDGSCRINFGLATNGGTAVASSVFPNGNFSPSTVIDGDRTGKLWGSGGGWSDGSRGVYPDWLEVSFDAPKRLNLINVYTLQDGYSGGTEPTATTGATTYGLIDFDVQYWDGSQWITVPGGEVRGNSLALRPVALPDVTTTKVRVLVHNARVHYSRIVELEAYGCPAT